MQTIKLKCFHNSLLVNLYYFIQPKYAQWSVEGDAV